jgi:hypothetical protein
VLPFTATSTTTTISLLGDTRLSAVTQAGTGNLIGGIREVPFTFGP